MADPYSLYFARQTPYVGASHGGGPPFQTGLNAPIAAGTILLGPSSVWYNDITGASVNANSATWLGDLGANNYQNLAGGWTYPGTGQTGNQIQGIPYYVVDSATQPLVPVVFGPPVDQVPSESDIAWCPIPLRDDIVEGVPDLTVWPAVPGTLENADSGDRHLCVIDLRKRVIYELYKAYRRVDHWYAANVAIWDMDGGDIQRPFANTSADVAGLPVIVGLLLGCQVTGSRIDHAFRYTIQHQVNRYLSPNASHAQTGNNANAAPFGARLRLKASKSVSGGANTQAVVTAMKKYGIINADTGGALQGIGDSSAWDYADGVGGQTFQDLHAALAPSDFEAIDTGQTQYVYLSSDPTGTPPTATLSSSAAEVNSGTQVTLTPSWTGKAMACVGQFGIQKAATAVVDTPTRDAWYQLDVGAPYGRAKAIQRVIVTNGTQRWPSYDRYVSPTGSNSNDGLTTGTPWAITALTDTSKTHLIAGFVVGFMDGTYDVSGLSSSTDSLLQIPPGTFGKPTVLQALNSRLAIISSGAVTKPIFGSYYQGICQIQMRGLKLTTTGGSYNLSFYGSPEAGGMVDDCEFGGFSQSAIKLDGNPGGVFGWFLRNCLNHNSAGKYLAELQWAHDTHIRNLTADVGGLVWNDFGNNTNTVVD